ncbi:hypothetical protein AeMF1_004050 [Aphanomyces euteiches]|nr:hypothetical protein AeMF1_014272 [Aphanomyces euteiches]KAH9123006.1 hypothetical protein AeMF1_005903 [Aphanomyces euteiches]KAH9125310.1 hypothetical protein AeMF1_004050 [Aphanomyces euteiches]
MQSRRDFTIEEARRSRISEGARAGYASGINQIVIWAQRNGESRLLMPSPDYADKSTLDLSIFSYWDFLDFLQWTVRNKPTITAQTLSGYRSALKSLYKDQMVELPAAYNDDMKEIFSGIKKRLAKDLHTGRIVDSGKRPLTFSMFEDLCGKSLVLQDGGFTHLFLILTWNLMCCLQSTETVRFDHISSEEDAIRIHSIRKGVATYACSCTTGGPSIVSVCLRYEAAGDQFTGHVVAGLPVNSARFAVLPPSS